MTNAKRREARLPEDSPFRRAPLEAKLLVAFVLISACAFADRRSAALPLGVLAVALGLLRLCRIPVGRVLRPLLRTLPIVLGASALALFSPSGGLAAFGSLALRSIVCLFVVQLLAATTKPGSLLSLARRMHAPPAMVSSLAFLSRYLDVVREEVARMHRARAARNFGLARPRLWLISAGLVGDLFVRAVDRSERIEASMRARGGG